MFRVVEQAHPGFRFQPELADAAVADMVVVPGQRIGVQQMGDGERHGGAVAHHHHVLARVAGGDVLEGVAHAPDHAVEGLAALGCPVRVLANAVEEADLLDQLPVVGALEFADAVFAQVGHRLGFQAEAAADAAGGVVGALQRAGVDRPDRMGGVGEPVGDSFHLGAAQVGQRAVGPAVPVGADVGGDLAVADQPDAGACFAHSVFLSFRAPAPPC
ncbi:MAG: hypothetical protein U5R48_11410 [Gammaproteobacteria bacterium]|nr:hypothetical protein [Gammaproteobacteria bacterium]